MITERLERLLEDRQRGCSEILSEALECLELLEREKALEFARKLAKAHSKMKGFVKVMEELERSSVREVRKRIERANEEVSAKLSEIIEGKTVTTISKSGIVARAIKLGVPRKVYVLVSRPGEEGKLMAEKVGAKIVEDSEMGWFVRRSDVVVCGADALTKNGFVNKVGTLPLALTAKHFGVEFYVASPLYKFVTEVDPELPFEFVNRELATLLTERGITEWELLP